MKRSFQVSEIITSSFLTIWGGLSLYFIVNSILIFRELGLIQFTSRLQVLKDYHLVVLVPLFTLAGGLLLLFGKRIGWIICLAMLPANAFLFIIPAEKGKSPFDSASSILLFSLIAIVSLILFCVLASKPFRTKYDATNRTWLQVSGLTIIILVDKMILFLL